MTVTVRCYGHFIDVAPEPLVLDVAAGSTVADVAELLERTHPRLAGVATACRFAVASSYVPATFVLGDGAELAAIPPVSGG